jgi:hypothetical protein
MYSKLIVESKIHLFFSEALQYITYITMDFTTVVNVYEYVYVCVCVCMEGVLHA